MVAKCSALPNLAYQDFNPHALINPNPGDNIYCAAKLLERRKGIDFA